MSDTSTSSKKLSINALCSQFSTRFLIEIALDPERYTLEFSDGKYDFRKSYEKHTQHIYIIDTSGTERKEMESFFTELSNSKVKGLRRVVLITHEPVHPENNRMYPFGPLCFIEGDFSRGRFREILGQVMTIRDTGVRVKSDSGFFDISVFKR